MIYKGIFDIEVNGEKKFFKTGTKATAIFCLEENITLKQFSERLSDPTPFTVINIGFAAAKAYYESKKLEINFSKDDVADWIDEYGLIEFLNKVLESMNTYEDKAEKNAVTLENQNPGLTGQ